MVGRSAVGHLPLFDVRRRFAFHWSWLKAGITVRGGGVGEDGAPVEEDGSVSGGPGGTPTGRGRSGQGAVSAQVSSSEHLQ